MCPLLFYQQYYQQVSIINSRHETEILQVKCVWLNQPQIFYKNIIHVFNYDESHRQGMNCFLNVVPILTISTSSVVREALKHVLL